ncbi:ABC-three component system middle component 6 [Jeotgalibacillus salarius]|uniref:ABC-three component system middle component 6 n=1 Tax=Jeotgalibacillus salarius TaxID=546023 RepID=UPI003C7D704F
MIRPHKYMDLKLSIFNLSYIIIHKLKEKNKYPYEDLYRSVSREIEEEGLMELFNLSLTFLYALGKIHYNKDLDVVELLL